MSSYSALIKKNSAQKIEDIIFLKEGFSWPAFLFGSLWFFYQRMWREFFVVLVFDLAFASLENFVSPLDGIFLHLAFSALIALNANYWLATHLKKKNYQFAGMALGENLASAQINFLQNFQADESDFDEAIIAPKLHRQKCKMHKKIDYFAV